jgi:DNA-binding transcriptional LysR family regulator
MDLDLRLVRYFVAVADELHFGRAAAKLHVSQPALSRQVRKLEDVLGFRLLVRDSRHVALTPRGEVFLADARELLALSERMQHPPHGDGVRIAHIFELATSRVVADAYSQARPDIPLVEHAMHSVAQLDALVDNRLDVAILRVCPQMLTDHPRGWSHTLLRLEPMRLVGRPGDPPLPTISLFERPTQIFADRQDSGLYNAHGDWVSAFEGEAGVSLRWLGTPGAFSHCLTVIKRQAGTARLLEFGSYAARYQAAGFPVHDVAELRPYYPWSIAWRDGRLPDATSDFLEIAHQTAARQGWGALEEGPAPQWLPKDDPVAQELGWR